MRDPQQRRRRWAGGATTLLLALALAGCGGGDAGDNAAAGDSAQIAANKGKGPSGGGGPDSCAPPPVAPDAVLRGSWSGLLTWMSNEGVTFPNTPENVSRDSVPLCVNGNGCAPIEVQLQSTAQTYCLTGAQASQRRIMGMMVLVDSFPGQQPLPPIPAGDSIFLFARGNPGAQSPATLVYRQGNNVAQFPGSAGWNFVFCNDGMVNPGPAARWRTDVDSQAARTAGAQGDPSGGGPGGGTYGWLACANGCCQFYTPPPTAGGPNDSIPAPPPFCTPKNP